MDKMALAEQIHRLINGGDVTNNVGLEIWDIKMFVDQAHAAIVKNELLQSKAALEYQEINPVILATYDDVEIIAEEKHGRPCRWYSNLPVDIVNLPHDMGVWEIAPCCDPFNNVKRLPNGAHSMYGEFLLSIPGMYFWIEGKKVYYNNVPEYMDKVRMKLVSTDEDAEVSPELADMIRDYVVQRISGLNQIPEDKVSDNNKSV